MDGRILDDVSRCAGVHDLDEDEGVIWREGCDNCYRRSEVFGDRDNISNIEPPQIITFGCEYLIEE